jgi:hypothetical protein
MKKKEKHLHRLNIIPQPQTWGGPAEDGNAMEMMKLKIE